MIIQSRNMFEDYSLKKKLNRAKYSRHKLMNEVSKMDEYVRELEK